MLQESFHLRRMILRKKYLRLEGAINLSENLIILRICLATISTKAFRRISKVFLHIHFQLRFPFSEYNFGCDIFNIFFTAYFKRKIV